jgi:uncharacterized protein
MPSGRFARLAVLMLVPTLSLVAACGSSNNNNTPKSTPTATLSQAPTATATRGATFTATSLPSATATNVPPTATSTSQPPTATATAPSTATSTATAIPTGTTAATISATPTASPTPTATATSGPEGVAHGSVGQVYVTGAAPATALNLVGSDSNIVQTATTDANGSLIFRNVAVGTGYTVAAVSDPSAVSEPVVVTAFDAAPDPSLYQNQQIGPGYGYLRTRDGTLLSIMVYLPGPPENGPYPTVIEYSGYDPSNPDSPQPSTLIATTIGYAAVGVNIRGTGCSGGAFQFFEPLQSTDGYDVVETIAAQSWVKDHQVGMVGLSYPGITQLFVAQTQPPHLEAIAPLSVIADTGRGTLYPGGILNNGFATDWARDRQHDAMPGGQAWSQKRMDDGDQTCIDNMTLRGQTPDILQMIADNAYYVPAVADGVTPATFVHKINVPVFLAGAAQDEQVGGYFATMLDRFTGTDKVHFTLVNGGHTEPLIPEIFSRWMEFLSFYVRKETPQTPALASVIVNVLGGQIFTSPNLTLPPDRFTGASYEEALAQFESEPHVRVLFDDGAGSDQPGAPIPAFEHSFASYPIPGTEPTIWYFADGGALVPDAPTGDGADSFIYDPSNAQTTDYTGNGDGIWAALPAWQWEPLPDGKALAYATAPLAADTVMVGSGSVDLWLKASISDVDLQVTLTEIRPDGQETYIQNGWLRASRRALDPTQATILRPAPSGLEADVQPVPSDHYVLARVEIFPFAHAFRAGSRIRISIEAPGGDRPLWKFMSPAVDGQPIVDIARSAAFPSRIVLPVIPDVDVPTALPPCPSLRGQPCRTYVELDNTPG